MSFLRSLFLSFRHAFRGFMYAFKTQKNLRIEAIIAIVVVVGGIIIGLGMMSWLLVWASIVLVIVCEMFNSAIEALADVVNGKHDPRIKNVKDMAAASVFLSVLISAVIGILVFTTRVITLVNK
jgi:diacylglycerol kinase